MRLLVCRRYFPLFVGLFLEVPLLALLGVVYVRHAVEVAEPVGLFNLSASSTELVERCMISYSAGF